jgi:soluble lytic murein transglycosylase-like protein
MSRSQLAVTPSAAPSPNTSPTKLAIAPSPSSSGKFATSAGVRRFDAVFERYRGSIPLAYVRALVERESDGRPDVRTGGAVGLMQIVPVVLADYNKRHEITYQTTDLVDPSTNVAIGCELLRLIVESYRKNHPYVPNLQTDWNNPRFLELLTFGWNAGFSEAGGVGRVARYLEQLGGANDITLDLVTAYAELAGASKHLSNPAKVAWCKSVVVLCQRERALVGARPTHATS